MNDETINTGAEVDEEGTHFYVEFFCGVQWNRVELAGPEDATQVAEALRRYRDLSQTNATAEEMARIVKKVRGCGTPLALFDTAPWQRCRHLMAEAIEADDWGDELDDLARPIEPKEE